MNKKINILLLGLLGLLSGSCKKWLDLQPETEIAAPVLFSTREGFQEALLGVYTRCSKADLYGKELTVGTPEVLAQQYVIPNNDPFRYRQTALYAYRDGDFISRKDNIWKGLYNAITNCNLILENIDAKKSLFSGVDYELIKGEALALRAYLHFDALRLFAPSFLRNPSAEGVPYVTAYSKEITPMSSVGGVIDSAIRDLEASKALLSVDPIRDASYIVGYPVITDTTLNTEESAPQLFLQNRRHRMNYYAVCGELARIYLYKGDQVNALVNATDVIASNKFPWTSNSDFLAVDEDKIDRILYKELVFGWYIPGMVKELSDNWFRTQTSGMYVSGDGLNFVYEAGGVGSNDLRYKQWFVATSDQTTTSAYIVKYNRNSESEEEDANLHYLMAPAIRLSEMYYIAAECTYSNNAQQALDYVDQVRLHRGIGEHLSVSGPDAFRSELLKEYRKELYAEGQLFYAYKRLDRGIVGLSNNLIPASDQVFVLPLPDDEISYGGR